MVNMTTDEDGIADFLRCLAGLERKNSQLFEILSNKIVFPSIEPQLSKIADDTNKHAKIL